MRRLHYLYGRRYLADEELLKRRRSVFTFGAVDLARSMGLLDPSGPGSFTHPDLSRME